MAIRHDVQGPSQRDDMTQLLDKPLTPAKAAAKAAAELTPFRVHAFGAGIQSMALLEAWAFDSIIMRKDTVEGQVWDGFFPDGPPDICMFGDTQSEPPHVYRSVEFAKSICEEAGVPFETITIGNLAYPPKSKNGTQQIFTPLYTVCVEGHYETTYEPVNLLDRHRLDQLLAMQDEGILEGAELDEFNAMQKTEKKVWIEPGAHGRLRRQCTGRYKIDPVMKRAKELAGDRPIEIWLGVSIDEAHRMKSDPSDMVRYFYPLIFNQKNSGFAPMNRNDCKIFLKQIDWTAGKSACFMCPFHSDAVWGQMKKHQPEIFALACDYDERMRHARPGYACFVHRQRIPLRDVYFYDADPKVLDLGLFQGQDMSETGGCDDGYCGL
jgi:hypothetical protein